MAQLAHSQTANPALSTDDLLLAADVGGTYARVGLVRVDAGTPQVSRYRKYRCADYPSLEAILKDFLETDPTAAVRRGAIACAGYALDDAVINTNLVWPVSLSKVQRSVGLADLLLVNDFTAIAHATGYADQREVKAIATVDAPLAGPELVVGPGTGLGAAVRIPGGGGTQILSTEAGQAALTPSTEIEIEVLRHLLRKTSHVPVEHILSGPGLSTLYAALGAIRGETVQAPTPTQISAAAVAGRDALALEALRVFCGWLGSMVGNLVLLYGAQGGVILAGGILPNISEFLLGSDFVERFRDKGAMRTLLERVPVSLIEHGQLGVLGAAGWYLSRQHAVTLGQQL